MKIRIAGLQLGVNTWTEEIDPESLEIDRAVFREPVRVDVEADKRRGKVVMTLKSRSSGRLVCDRCGEEFTREIEGTSTVMWVQRGEAFSGEMQGDDLRSYAAGQDELDVTIDIRDSLLLAIPLKHLCREDCRGLCPRCGANLNLERCSCAGVANTVA